MSASSGAERQAAGRVEQSRLWSTLRELGGLGVNTAAGPGIWRASWSDPYRAAQRWLATLMKDAGLEVWVDGIGNTWGRWPADGQPALVIGSHIDAVPGGGKFDGTVGVLGALEAIKALRAAGFTPRREVRVVAWIEEEGTATGVALLGSRAYTGGLADDEFEILARQVRTADNVPARHQAEADRRLAAAGMKPGEVGAYLELHVEQGPVLCERGIPIGVVTGIVAVESATFDIHGVTNHAGGTPMDRRRDALVTAAEIVLAVRDVAISCGVRATCGKVELGPAASNIIPGKALLSLDVRAPREPQLTSFRRELQGAVDQIQARSGVSVDATRKYLLPAVATDPHLQECIRGAADALHLPSIPIHSGAGHDAMAFAAAGIPAGMIFVPSEGGISHAPDELTKAPDCANGAAVLALAIQHLAS